MSSNFITRFVTTYHRFMRIAVSKNHSQKCGGTRSEEVPPINVYAALPLPLFRIYLLRVFDREKNVYEDMEDMHK